MVLETKGIPQETYMARRDQWLGDQGRGLGTTAMSGTLLAALDFRGEGGHTVREY